MSYYSPQVGSTDTGSCSEDICLWMMINSPFLPFCMSSSNGILRRSGGYLMTTGCLNQLAITIIDSPDISACFFKKYSGGVRP